MNSKEQLLDKMRDEQPNKNAFTDLNSYTKGLSDMFDYLTSNPNQTHIIDDNVITHTVRHRKLDKYEFVCPDCNTVHTMSPYCVAQLSMGNDMVFKCNCGTTIDLDSFKK